MGDRNALLSRSWDAAAALYTKELAPRFLPWIQDGLSRVAAHCQNMQLPRGSASILVPCCGPGLEIPLLGQISDYAYPVVGVDLSPGMIAIANDLAAKHLQQVQQQGSMPRDPWAQQGSSSSEQRRSSMSAVVGDALDLHSEYGGQAVVVFSSFGLQQLGPKAPEALTSWVRCLCPGGLAVILIWPSGCEQQGPWHAYDIAVRKQQQQQQQQQSEQQPQQQSQQQQHREARAQASDSASSRPKAPAPSEWELQLTQAAQEVAGIALVEDTLIRHEMRWSDVEFFWEVMTQGGPWHARRLSFGDAHMDQLYAIFRKQLELEYQEGPGHNMTNPGALGDKAGDDQLALPARQVARLVGNESVRSNDKGVAGPAAAGKATLKPLVHTPAARLLVFRKDGRAGWQGAAGHPRVKL